MNSNYGRSTKSSFDFDLGINSINSRSSLNDQKNKTTTSSYNTTSSWQSSTTKPSWTHQPSASTHPVRPGSLNGPTSMVGDIMGKSWASLAPANSANNTSNNIGIVNKNPNLFGDLVGPALGNKTAGGGNVHLKNAAAAPVGVASKGGFSMGGMADTLPKTGSSWGYNGGSNVNVSNVGGNFKSPNLGGTSLMSSGGNGVGGGMKSSSNNKDPFGSLVDFGWKPVAGMKNASKVTVSSTSLGGDDGFGDFQKATKLSGSTSLSSSGFGGINSSSMGSSGGGAYSKMDDFGFASAQTRPPVQSTSKMGDFGSANVQTQPPVQSTGVDDFDVLLSSSAASVGGGVKSSDGLGSHQFSGVDDWDAEFGGGSDVGGTTELEGLPPPPAGVTAAAAKNKGMDNYKQGQYPDAIKWLSWAMILFGKAADSDGTNEVLSSRASCYKEVGEYKKAVADCTKVLEHDDKNVSVLVQRALLYESMEKYKLGAEDLRTAMKLDPGNRIAKSTIHRLSKMTEQ